MKSKHSWEINSNQLSNSDSEKSFENQTNLNPNQIDTQHEHIEIKKIEQKDKMVTFIQSELDAEVAKNILYSETPVMNQSIFIENSY